jgi:hypothetical protein
MSFEAIDLENGNQGATLSQMVMFRQMNQPRQRFEKIESVPKMKVAFDGKSLMLWHISIR